MEITTHRIIFRLFQFLVFTYVLFVSPLIFAEQHITSIELDQLSYGRTPSNINFFTNKNGEPGLIYQKSDEATPGELYESKYQNSEWTRPEILNILNQNAFELSGVKNLSDTSAILVLKGDDTDYAKVFGLTEPPVSPQNESDRLIPTISNEELDALLQNNQRLFFSLKNEDVWSPPTEIALTQNAINAVIETNGSGNAIVVYGVDVDGDGSTISDIELYYVVYKNNSWGAPVKLTNNTVIDYSFKIVYFNGSYLLVWIVDEDGNLSTVNDSRLYYSEINIDGNIIQAAVPVTSSANQLSAFILSANTTDLFLMWTDKPTGGSVELVETNYLTSTGWTVEARSPSPLSAQNAYNSELKLFGDKWILVETLNNRIQLSARISNRWKIIDKIDVFDNDGTQLSDIELFNAGDKVLLAYSGRKKIASDSVDLSQGKGLFVSKYLLSYDMTVSSMDYAPSAIAEGQIVNLNIQITNTGLMDSPVCAVEIWSDKSLLGEVTASQLSSGEVGIITYPVQIQSTESKLKIAIVNNPSDLDKTNDSLEYTLRVKPDFVVRDVLKTGLTTISADVMETKGVASASIEIEAYLQVGEVETLVATSTYVSTSVDPVIFDIPELSALSEDYSVTIKANPGKKVIEDSYINNNSAYFNLQQPIPDFKIAQFSVTDAEVKLIINNATQFSGSVGLLLTDDPEQFNKSGVLANPWFYQQITLSSGADTALSFPRSSLPAITEQYLYSVVNPYQIIAESNRNNNSAKKLVSSITANQSSGYVELNYGNEAYSCGNYGFEISNDGDRSALDVKISLTNSQGFVVASTQIPMLGSLAVNNLSLHDVPIGGYLLDIKYLDNGEYVSSGSQFINLSVDNCANPDIKLDLSADNLTYAGPSTDANKFDYEIDIDIIGYGVDYIKPLISVPLLIEVKQGTTVISTSQQTVYISGNNSSNKIKFQLNRSDLPLSGGYQLSVTAQQRTSEAATANNVAVTTVN